MKKCIYITLCFCLFMNHLWGQAMPARIKVVFPFPVSSVTLQQYWPISSYPSMELTGTNEYSYTSFTDNYGQVEFNIKYLAPQFFGGNYFYVAGFNGTPVGRPAGLVYGKVYINNVLLSNMYTTLNPSADGLNISAIISSDSSIVPMINSSHPHAIIDDRISPEVANRGFFKNPLPGSNYHYLAGWMQVITNNSVMDTCIVEVDYFRLYGRNGSTLTLLYEDTYDSFNQDYDGGLFLRYPFFPPGDYHEHPFPCTLNNGIMSFSPTTQINRVWHWWNAQQTFLNDLSQYTSYRAECRIKISGHAIAQAGIDCRIDQAGTPYELGTGNWVFENNGQWQNAWFDSGDTAVTIEKIKQENVKCYFDPSLRKVFYVFDIASKSDFNGSLFSTDGKVINNLVKVNLYPGKYSYSVDVQYLLVEELIFKVKINRTIFTGKVLVY